MADDSAAPSNPIPSGPPPATVPAKTPARPPVNPWAVGIASLFGLAILAGLGYLIWDKFRGPHPAPDRTPRAVVTGMFLAVQAGPAQADPSNPTAPIGMFRLDASGSHSPLGPIRWKFSAPSAIKPTLLTPAGGLSASIAEVVVTETGQYRFHPVAIGADRDGKTDVDVGVFSYTVGAPTPPTPPAPIPPAPPPGPPGPDPVPPVVDAPIAGDGLRVLVVYESADLGKYPAAQVNALRGGPFLDYLVATCPKVGGVPEARFYDKDTDLANESKTWRDAMKRPHPTLPWIVVSNGKTGFEGPMPATDADILALAKKYGESK